MAYLAMIVPLSGGEPTHPIAPGGGPSTGPGFPTHPIAPGGRRPGVAEPARRHLAEPAWRWRTPDQGLPRAPGRPDQGLPGYPGGPSQGPGFPTHPIAPGGQPPGIWGGAPPYVDIRWAGISAASLAPDRSGWSASGHLGWRLAPADWLSVATARRWWKRQASGDLAGDAVVPDRAAARAPGRG
jgi:hypothetical protein